jgi:hypothetical protein
MPEQEKPNEDGLRLSCFANRPALVYKFSWLGLRNSKHAVTHSLEADFGQSLRRNQSVIAPNPPLDLELLSDGPVRFDGEPGNR